MRSIAGAPRRPELRETMRDWLNGFLFTHFVTLATNNPMISQARMLNLLKGWDARVNRELIGPRWKKRSDERINWRAFPEKLGSNPHWHVLLEVLEDQVEAIEHGDVLERHWRDLISSGTACVDRVRDKGALLYATKHLDLPDNWGAFVSSVDWIRR